ncbi:DNA-binding response regulator [Streptomyces agglomeratus]|uniref:DNA-binding response regulator n=1 Tax=Streptomyces agglomeratus TaxID=285458 RepID=A0A1E5PGB1_9ACTN|nr:response regulator transcription factor [Streptomyces agglomeratus]OEJ28562.1 DNA-binding response regulator [Streptomyces agglomeratus]OEJ37376.1 DNA-binding response regulator [Streptomyces agglomeratus]OEJ48241.1 DNA-binding response regulator [Streptomyces agglomeratus]OEJ49917.1 DNA-binding response regulator [Streptomyces agglomeratus]OEJ57245.1 DNA-binding response regulator [Streptomyces agglomeratus]
MIKVLVVDDQQLVRMGLRMLFDHAPDVEIVGEAGNGAEAVRLAGRSAPDVVLMDLRMPGTDGITATRLILAARPATRVVALTTFDDDEHLYGALAAGACGLLVKDTPPAEVLDAVRRAVAGESPFSRGALDRLVTQAVEARSASDGPAEAPLPNITPRERQVLGLLGVGLSNKEIADRLHMGVTTVKTHVASLMTKTGRDNRIRLAVLAVLAGVTAD